jgi:hypothetical protein
MDPSAKVGGHRPETITMRKKTQSTVGSSSTNTQRF